MKSTGPMNMTGGFSSITKGELDIMNETSVSMSLDAKLDSIPDDEFKQRTACLSQIPQNSAKIDYKFTFPQPSLRKKMAAHLKQKNQVKNTSFG
jgi:hypothetical protein